MRFRSCFFHVSTVSTISLCPKPFSSLAGNHLLMSTRSQNSNKVPPKVNPNLNNEKAQKLTKKKHKMCDQVPEILVAQELAHLILSAALPFCIYRGQVDLGFPLVSPTALHWGAMLQCTKIHYTILRHTTWNVCTAHCAQCTVMHPLARVSFSNWSLPPVPHCNCTLLHCQIYWQILLRRYHSHFLVGGAFNCKANPYPSLSLVACK